MWSAMKASTSARVRLPVSLNSYGTVTSVVVSHVAQCPSHDLSGCRPRQVVHELDVSRHLVWRQPRAYMGAKLVAQLVGGLAAGLQHDKSLRYLSAALVGNALDGGHGDRRVRAEAVLDLTRADPVPGGVDDVVLPRLEPDVAILVHRAEVPAQQPVVEELLLRGRRVVEVLEHRQRVMTVDRDLAALPGDRLSVVVENRDDAAGQSAPERARLHRVHLRTVATDTVELGLPVCLVDRAAKELLRPPEQVGTERLATGADRAEGEVAAGQVGSADHPQCGRRKQGES